MSARTGRTRFGDFELDSERGTLVRDGRRVRIQPQPLRVLAYLVERAGTVVTRDELRQAIWDQATFVEFDQGLNYCIRQIRQALHDDAVKPVYVETLKKRGYAFIAPVEHLSETAVPVVRPSRVRLALYPALAVAVVVALVAAAALLRQKPRSIAYTQLTSFNNAAFSPAISPDGRMIAFLVGTDIGFPFKGEIYTKLMPTGEPVQRTHDGFLKYGVAFSPDGSQITYTVADSSHGWSIASLPALGGDARLLFGNAAGLTWLDGEHALFSETKSGLHMGLVTGTTSRANLRDIYLPAHERGMAHYSSLSPDRTHVLIVEMAGTGAWARCRVVPFDGTSPGSEVGPQGACTSAAWSPDGAWMYFAARVKGASHLWRQRYPAGDLEQLTFGPLEEDGIALSADGRSMLTSAGILESGAWMHDAAGDRLISPEGYAAGLSFSRDRKHLYYLLRRESRAPNELWTTDMASGKSAVVVSGFPIDAYDISDDGSRVVFAARTTEGVSQLWLAPCNGETQPRLLAMAGETEPFFAAEGEILFRASDGAKNHLFGMAIDGSRRHKIIDAPIIEINGMSPDRKLVLVAKPVDEALTIAVFAVSLRDSSMTRICPGQCFARWNPDGSRFYVQPFLQGGVAAGKVISMPVPTGESIPRLPDAGVRSTSDAAALPGSTILDFSAYDPARFAPFVTPGPSKDTFAFTRTISHRNLFQLDVPN